MSDDIKIIRDGLKGNGIASKAFEDIVGPWLANVFNKYKEEEFHKIMSTSTYEFNGKIYTGFDYVVDWNRNHKKKMLLLRPALRVFGKRVNIDYDHVLKNVLLLLKNRGWSVNEDEQRCFYHTILKVGMMMQR